MTNQNDSKSPIQPNMDKNEWRAMWIISAVVVLLIVGGMGLNVLFHHDTPQDEGQTQNVQYK